MTPAMRVAVRAMLQSKSPDGSEDADAKKAIEEVRSALLGFLPETMHNGEAGLFITDQALDDKLKST